MWSFDLFLPYSTNLISREKISNYFRKFLDFKIKRVLTVYTRSKRVIIYLFGELFFTEFVESEELSCKDDILNEPNTGQLHTDDDLPIWNHHGNSTEVDLQVFWQLLTSCIAGVLGRKKKIKLMFSDLFPTVI